jgi:hypothetical protein
VPWKAGFETNNNARRFGENWRASMRLPIFAACLIVLTAAVPALAHHKPGHQIPPGQAKKSLPADIVIGVPPPEVDNVCLITTESAGDPMAPIVVTAWLPRDIAESKAAEGESFIIYHPDFNSEAGCLEY